jgi:hypothetical protein
VVVFFFNDTLYLSCAGFKTVNKAARPFQLVINKIESKRNTGSGGKKWCKQVFGFLLTFVFDQATFPSSLQTP